MGCLALRRIAVLSLFLGGTVQVPTIMAQGATTGPIDAGTWVARFEALVQTELASLPAEFRSKVRDETFAAVRDAEARNSACLPGLHKALNEHLSNLAKSFESSPQRERLELAWLRYVARDYVDFGEVSTTDQQVVASQIADVVEQGRRWCASQFPGISESVLSEAIRPFEDLLETVSTSGLNPVFRRPLDTEVHQTAINQWLDHMEGLRKPLEVEYGIYELEPGSAPEWEYELLNRRQIELLKTLLGTYIEVRRSLHKPMFHDLDLLFDAYLDASQLHAQARQKAGDDPERQRSKQEERRWALDVQEYEVALILSSALLPGSPFELRTGADASRFALGPIDNYAPGPVVLEFTIEYQADDGVRILPDAWESVSGFIISNGHGSSRAEVVSRTPLWITRGVFHEPIGISIRLLKKQAFVYFPGLGKFDLTELTADSWRGAYDRPTLLVPRDLRAYAEVGNLLAVSTGKVVTSSPGAEGGRSMIEVIWDTCQPGLYAAPISRATYTFEGDRNAPALREATLKTQTGDDVAVIRWSSPVLLADGRRCYRDVEIETFDTAFTSSPGQDNPAITFAEARTLRWRYEVAEGTEQIGVTPAECTITTASGKELLRARFKHRPDNLVWPEDLASPLEFPPGETTLRTDYYSLLKDNYSKRKQERSLSPEVRASLIRRAENLLEQSKTQSDNDISLGTQHLLANWYRATGDWKSWEVLAKEHIVLLAQAADEKQVWLCVSMFMGQAAKGGHSELAYAIMSELENHVYHTMTAPGAIEKGAGLAFGGGAPQAVACFRAAARKLPKGSPFRQKALLGLTGACQDAYLQWSTAEHNSDACRQLAREARASFDEFLQYSTDDEKSEAADAVQLCETRFGKMAVAGQ